MQAIEPKESTSHTPWVAASSATAATKFFDNLQEVRRDLHFAWLRALGNPWVADDPGIDKYRSTLWRHRPALLRTRALD